MPAFQSLERVLEDWSGEDSQRNSLAETVGAIAGAAAELSELIAQGPLAGALGVTVGDNADGDAQKELDIRANELFLEELRKAPVAVFGSEENDAAVTLDPTQPLAVAIDPLDGSSNIDTNVSVGTIFSILPADDFAGALEAALTQPGKAQLAAGFVIYGPQTALVLTLGEGTQVFNLDRSTRQFRLIRADVRIPEGKAEYAINASNYRHWDEPIRSYIDDLISGAEGPRGRNFNMRWIASLVAEAFRILSRGGIFLYPRDGRPGYEAGRLRLVYEANPIAFVVEQAGGGATDGIRRILEIQPSSLHQRIPLIFGSRDKVDRVRSYHDNPNTIGERSPLFARRGLFRA